MTDEDRTQIEALAGDYRLRPQAEYSRAILLVGLEILSRLPVASRPPEAAPAKKRTTRRKADPAKVG